jgi:perosamine synthetase
MEKRNIPISLPVTGEAEWQATKACFDSGWLTSGPKVREFENNFAKRHGVKHALAVTSATTALHLACVALGVGPGDEVIVPAFTWVSTANVVVHCGAKVVFVDIDPVTFNLDPSKLAAVITSKTKAIMVVHLFGLCADMDAIRSVAPGIPLIEDGACAAGAGYNRVPAGALGSIGCFSFHPRKSVTTGEGGMLTTNDDALGDLMSSLRNHGASISEEQRHHGAQPYILPAFVHVGYNYRMTDIQGAVGVVQLGRLDEFIAERAHWAAFYARELAGLAWLRLPTTFLADSGDKYSHGWQSFVTMVDEAKAPFSRNEIMAKLQDLGVSTRPGTHAVHMLDCYAKPMHIAPGDFPGARQANDHSMSIPLHNRMTAEDYAYVVEALKSL